MTTIQILDSKNYDPHWPIVKRDSVRAIIFKDDRLLMIRSQKFGEIKFPGGGIEPHESHSQALIREVMEETGLSVLPQSIKEYGKTLILRKDFDKDQIFEQISYYYTCEVDHDHINETKLDPGYETEYGYKLAYLTLDEAIKINQQRLHLTDIFWVQRELTVLQQLQNNLHEEKI